jgi:uridine kinase
MIGDRVIPKPHQTAAAEELLALLGTRIRDRTVIGIAGESGSGKSEIAVELIRFLEEKKIPAVMFQQDDYFFYPPKTNEEARRRSVKSVGLGEVNLRLLDEHMGHFKRAPESVLQKPLVVFHENRITRETIDPMAFEVAIVEGTYTTLLKNVDWRVFIDRSYKDTIDDRKERSRDTIDEFSEQVLELEHKIIARHKTMAHIVVNGDFSLTPVDMDEDRG